MEGRVVAALKADVKGHVRDFLRKEQVAGYTGEGVFALRGPSPYLRICLLLTVWTVLPALVLHRWKFHFLAVSRDAVIVIAISKVTLAPKKIVSITPREQMRIDDVRGGRMWTRLRFTDATGATHRYNISRTFHTDLDDSLAALGAPPRPHALEPTKSRGHHGKHGK